MRSQVTDERYARTSKTAETSLPLGSTGSSGRGCWYFVHCPEGRERSLCKDVERAVSSNVLTSAFVPRMEKEVLEEGRWRKSVVTVFSGYFVVETDDPSALQQEILKHTYPVYVAGKVGDGFAPMDREARDFLTAVMDRDRTIRFSNATVGEQGLSVSAGPLVGHEDRIVDQDLRGHSVRVNVCTGTDGTEKFSLFMPVRVDHADAVPGSAKATAKHGDGLRRSQSLPLTRRTPKGRLRWYLAECPEGHEEVLCEALHEAIPRTVLHDACVPKTEVLKKVHGEWVTTVREVFVGRFAVSTTDAAALNASLKQLGLPVRLAGDLGGGYAPIDDDAWRLLESCMDSTRTIRESRGEIVDNELRVWSGPLKGREALVARYARRKSLAFVNVGEDALGSHSIVMPLAITVRR